MEGRPEKRKHNACHTNHEGFSSIVRIPTKLVEPFISLKSAISAESNSIVLDWLFRTCNNQILEVIQANEDNILPQSCGDAQMLQCAQSLEQNNAHEELVDEEGIDDLVHDSNSASNSNSSRPSQEVPKGTSKRSIKFGFMSKQKLEEFFSSFKIMCPFQGCNVHFTETCINPWREAFSMKFTCLKNHTYSWQSVSLEYNHSVPEVVGSMYHAALSTGLSFTQLKEFLAGLQLKVPERGHFYDFQKGVGRNLGWVDAVLNIWKEQKLAMYELLKTRSSPIIVYIDARYDSAQFAYHGTAPILDAETGDVIEMVTKTKKECGNSWHIEEAAITEGLQNVLAAGVQIGEAVHDDKKTVDIVLDQLNIVSQKDLWHKCKKLKQKFHKELCEAKKGKDGAMKSVDDCTFREEIESLTMPILKEWLKNRNAKISGKKDDLVHRYMELRGLLTSTSTASTTSDFVLLYPELNKNDVAYKLKGWIYICCRRNAELQCENPNRLVEDIKNVAEHWAGIHDLCKQIDPQRPCVQGKWGLEQAYFEKNGSAHLAVAAWLRKSITMQKFEHYTRARENYLSETFHSLINKYASKRIHWPKSHFARLACAAMDWNENRSRHCLGTYDIRVSENTIRQRPPTKRILPPKTFTWKEDVKQKIFEA